MDGQRGGGAVVEPCTASTQSQHQPNPSPNPNSTLINNPLPNVSLSPLHQPIPTNPNLTQLPFTPPQL